MRYTVRVPATSANLGPGFDCMGLALTLYNTFTASPSDSLTVTLSGMYTHHIPVTSNNLLWDSMCRLWQEIGEPEQPVALEAHNLIPPARGLGSSSTAVVGGLLLANALSGTPLSRSDLLGLACMIEGHPDNVTPAFLGGVTLTVQDDDTILPRVLAAKPDFKVVVVIPDILVETEKARAILPSMVSREDLIFNTSRAGLLVNAFMSGEYELLAVATKDRVHQNQRADLIPGMDQALQMALENGAYGAFLSGSGPTLLALCPEQKSAACARAMKEALWEARLISESVAVDVDEVGAQFVSS
ncbi:MAG: homoserine kinase [Peptococcaceae bacterium]|nr:homoserine kinase [Peptococcaceae bacterium]